MTLFPIFRRIKGTKVECKYRTSKDNEVRPSRIKGTKVECK